MRASRKLKPGRSREGRWHSPAIAFVAGILLPGAGQAYNGRPFRAALVFVLSPLLMPWLAGSLTARRRAQEMVLAGGRHGRGGLFWILMHGWLAANLLLLLFLILTWEGYLS